jgi:hypothetical protein
MSLNVTGPDAGGGSAAAPTMAVLQFHDSVSGILVTVELVDSGGNGLDTMTASQAGTPTTTGCGLVGGGAPPETGTLTDGRAVLTDAQPLPTQRGSASTAAGGTIRSSRIRELACASSKPASSRLTARP